MSPRKKVLPKLPLYWTAIDRDALHAYLFRKANTRGIITFMQKDLAEDLGISIHTMSEIVRDFIKQGRVRKLTANGYQYAIKDPEEWRAEQ